MNNGQTAPRKLIQGDDMYAKTYYIGKSIVHIDDSYLQERTPEQEKRDMEALDEAMWAIADELGA